MEMSLSERKRRILRALAEEHIKTNEPVSSKDLSEKYLTDFSSATIRNELAAMEEQGVISKTHTSSGRVPTALGYQMFIDEILPLARPTAKEMERLKTSIVSRTIKMEDVAARAADAISEACGLPSVVFSGITRNATIESVKIFKVTETTALVVVVTNEGIIKDVAIDSSASSQTACDDASEFLSKALNGKRLCEVSDGNLIAEMQKFNNFVSMLLNVLEQSHAKISTSGQGKLLSRFETKDEAQKVYDLLDNKTELQKLAPTTEEVSVQMKNVDGTDCAVVSMNILGKNHEPMSVMIMGPARMDYGKAIKTLKGLKQIMDEEQP